MNTSGKGLKKQHQVFLAWLIETFGYTINRVSMAEIGLQSHRNTQTVLNYMYRLEKCGCLSISKMSAYKWVVTIKNNNVKNEKYSK